VHSHRLSPDQEDRYERFTQNRIVNLSRLLAAAAVFTFASLASQQANADLDRLKRQAADAKEDIAREKADARGDAAREKADAGEDIRREKGDARGDLFRDIRR
jgi:hypothetical protein